MIHTIELTFDKSHIITIGEKRFSPCSSLIIHDPPFTIHEEGRHEQ